MNEIKARKKDIFGTDNPNLGKFSVVLRTVAKGGSGNQGDGELSSPDAIPIFHSDIQHEIEKMKEKIPEIYMQAQNIAYRAIAV